jgi:hypothetical protein
MARCPDCGNVHARMRRGAHSDRRPWQRSIDLPGDFNYLIARTSLVSPEHVRVEQSAHP